MQPSFQPIAIKSRIIDQFVRSTAASYGPRSHAGQRPHALLIHPEDRAELSGFALQLLQAVGIDAPIHYVNDEGEADRRFFDPHPDPLIIDEVERFSASFKLKLALAYANPRHTRPPLVLFLVKRTLAQLMADESLEPKLAMRMIGTLVWPKMSDRWRDMMPLFQAFVLKSANRGGREIEINTEAYQHLRRHWKSRAPKTVHEIRQLAERAVLAAENGRICASCIQTAIEMPAVLLASP
ncbi:hypothetical protein IT407_00135 [Candidatus Uhrbacteria bacterium]|nr:hypothetical protein [Candidatus Uhrbacteria bacterium]